MPRLATLPQPQSGQVGAADPAAAGGRAARVASVDIVRGGVMVLMALDHVRDFVTNLRFQPENLERGSAALFAPRWVTHFCAPAFFLLAGIGIGITKGRGQSNRDLTEFLLTRGVWLIVAELTFTAVGWRFDLNLMPLFGIVLWALGWSMIVMAALIWLPPVLLAGLSLATIALHNLTDGVRPADFGALAPLWHFLHVPGFAIPGKLLIAYPLVPWVAVMALGFVLADVYQWSPRRRRNFLVSMGVAATLLFVAMRAVNDYGNAQPWTAQRTPALTVASFLNVTKYPPSLQFLLMTLGPTLVVLALAERLRGRLSDWLKVYGSVPFFFYVVHIFVAHAVGVALALIQGGELRRIPVVLDPGSLPAWYGVSLPGVYVAWALVVILMYFPCRWFARIKRTRGEWWLRYL
ncbi:MAG: heparan-alpha-glucosaminide N-acetyltransferase domain-containing protein [Gemmatimonadota bacterium]|nr:heparan-alpha-glucosaminide N-acetyltransferase domain-containing protein [Gemmatimonadota bacterium]